MLVVNRFRVDEADDDSFRADVTLAHELLARQPGYVDGVVARNVDDPGLWVLSTRWRNVGSYRRALSSYDVKLHAVATLAKAIDEPSAYEIVAPGEAELNKAMPRSLG